VPGRRVPRTAGIDAPASFLLSGFDPAFHHDRISRPQKRKGRALTDLSIYELTFTGTILAVPKENRIHNMRDPCTTPRKTPPIRFALPRKIILSRVVNR
jgi:hypothetical protein